jgi:hypothetical protein
LSLSAADARLHRRHYRRYVRHRAARASQTAIAAQGTAAGARLFAIGVGVA